MSKGAAEFRSGAAVPTQEGRLVRLAGSIERGTIEVGMSVCIGLNIALSMTVTIARAFREDDEDVLLLDCEDDEVAAVLVALNLTGELFQVGCCDN